MKATHHLLPPIGTALAALGLLLSAAPSEASLRAQNYSTPAYIDFYITEWTVSESEKEISIVVLRTGEFRQVTTIDFQTAEGTAIEGRDYKGTGGTMVFQPLESSKIITIGILPDHFKEDDETFSVKLSSEDLGVFLVRDTASVLIQDAPAGPPVLAIRPGPDSSLVLSWSAETECVLERAPTVASSTWEAVSAEPVLKGDQYEVIQPVQEPVFLYRLRQQ